MDDTLAVDSMRQMAADPVSPSRKPSEYISAIYELSELVVKRQRHPPHFWDWIYWRSPEGKRFRKACDVVHGYTGSIVQSRRAELEQQGAPEIQVKASTGRKKVTDFIDVLLLSKVCVRSDYRLSVSRSVHRNAQRQLEICKKTGMFV